MFCLCSTAGMMLCLCLCALALVLQPIHAAYNCSSVYNRVPGESVTFPNLRQSSILCSLLDSKTSLFCLDNNDLMVQCGTSIITLEVNLCTAEWAGFDPNGLALNGERNNAQCRGTIDTTVDPPVIRYLLAVNHSQENPCRQSLQVQRKNYICYLSQEQFFSSFLKSQLANTN